MYLDGLEQSQILGTDAFLDVLHRPTILRPRVQAPLQKLQRRLREALVALGELR